MSGPYYRGKPVGSFLCRIAAGIGFYEGAVISTIVIYITLILLKRTEKHIARKNNLSIFYIQTEDLPGQIGTIGCIFGKHNNNKNIELSMRKR